MAESGSEASPPYRAEHVGSFPRPDRLLQAREDFASRKISKADLKRIEDECIREVVAMQERVGIGVVTDGEFRKSGWHSVLFDSVEGYGEPVAHSFRFRLFDGTVLDPTGVERRAVKKLSRRSPLAAADYSELKQMTKRPIKANVPTPSVAHAMVGAAAYRDAYPDLRSYLADLAAIYREEIADLAARGCTYLQMDEVPLALLCDPANREVVRQRGDDPDALIDAYIEAINDCLRDRPNGMTVCLHLCRGNIGHGMASGGYDYIAEKLFNQVRVDGFFLEYDTERAGDFSPLRHVPSPKRVVLGLLSTKTLEPEPVDLLMRRIDEATRYVELDRLALSPQCGFSSSTIRRKGRLELGNVESKLARVVEVAAKVWG